MTTRDTKTSFSVSFDNRRYGAKPENPESAKEAKGGMASFFLLRVSFSMSFNGKPEEPLAMFWGVDFKIVAVCFNTTLSQENAELVSWIGGLKPSPPPPSGNS